MSDSIDPIKLLKPRRRIQGISASLLPLTEAGEIDWVGFEQHVQRTALCGLIPAVNMDTGYAPLLTSQQKQEALRRARSTLGGGPLIAGALVADQPGDRFDWDAYRRCIDEVHHYEATPIIFQSYGLTGGEDVQVIARYEQLAGHCDRFIAFELGQQFAPFGSIYSLALFEQLVRIKQCVGAKHSSLSRRLEWQRLILRDRVRPDFQIFTGNDLAIDMVMYGSDYLLGLSTFAPDAFAVRDRLWLDGDAAFYELNDLLQTLGGIAFRSPVPAYKHSAAMFLKLRGWIDHDRTHSASPMRPDSDRQLLEEFRVRLQTMLESIHG